MRSILVMAGALVLTAAAAQAQSNYNTTNPVEYNHLMNGRTYDSMRSSLESQGGVGQYGTYLYTAGSVKASGGYSGSGNQTIDKTYRVSRYGTDAAGQGFGSYSTTGMTGGTLSRASFGGMGRTGGSFGR